MAQLLFLFHDVVTFLALLSAEEIHPLGSRYLPPTALAKLARLLIVSDPIALTQSRNSHGHWRAGTRLRTTERQAERIRLIHYLAEAAQFVARTGAVLKPTPWFSRWLTDSPQARAHTLWRAAFPTQPTHADDQLWRAFGLPGKHLASPLATLQQLFELFRHLPTDYRIKTTTLIKLLALPVFDDDAPENRPATLLDGWLKLLEWWGIIARDQRASVQLTAVGAVLIDHPAAPPWTMNPTPQPLHWSTTRGATLPDLIAPRDADPACVFALSDYAIHHATLTAKTESRRMYQLDPARVQTALARGVALTKVYDCLERATGDAVPRRVDEWLLNLVRASAHVTVRSALVLQVDDPTVLTELTRAKVIRQCVQSTLSPRAVIVRPGKLATLARQLAHRGYPTNIATPLRGTADKSFDQPTLAHLYISARLAHQRGETYRPPYSLILDLEARLGARDRTCAEEILSAARPLIKKPALNSWQPSDIESCELEPCETRFADLLASIQRALATQTVLEIVYHSPHNDETTTRVVEPLRLEYRAAIPYLIAFCRARQDERAFRVARIQQLTALAVEHGQMRAGVRK
jgi:hypothetical protein